MRESMPVLQHQQRQVDNRNFAYNVENRKLDAQQSTSSWESLRIRPGPTDSKDAVPLPVRLGRIAAQGSQWRHRSQPAVPPKAWERSPRFASGPISWPRRLWVCSPKIVDGFPFALVGFHCFTHGEQPRLCRISMPARQCSQPESTEEYRQTFPESPLVERPQVKLDVRYKRLRLCMTPALARVGI